MLLSSVGIHDDVPSSLIDDARPILCLKNLSYPLIENSQKSHIEAADGSHVSDSFKVMKYRLFFANIIYGTISDTKGSRHLLFSHPAFLIF